MRLTVRDSEYLKSRQNQYYQNDETTEDTHNYDGDSIIYDIERMDEHRLLSLPKVKASQISDS